jgi:hypothetical protein
VGSDEFSRGAAGELPDANPWQLAHGNGGPAYLGRRFPAGGGMKDEGVSQGLTRFFDRLSPEERASLTELLRQPRTYLAEDMTDVLAILRSLED